MGHCNHLVEVEITWVQDPWVFRSFLLETYDQDLTKKLKLSPYIKTNTQ